MSQGAWVPRYREIEQALRARVASLRPGDRVPSDTELCEEFGVSRMTARSAVAQLAAEGLIVRDPGRGSFVAEPPAHRRADSLMTFTREMRRQGRLPSSRLLDRSVRPASGPEAADLHLAAGDPVVSLRRIRLADGEPVAFEHAVLPGRTAPAVLVADLVGGSLHEALIAGGFVPVRGQATIVAEAATDEDAAVLGVARGVPLLVERRVIVDEDGRPLERTCSRYPADRYALDVAFSVEPRRTSPTQGRASVRGRA